MFSRIFIERPRFAMVISIVFVLMGIMAVTQLPIAEYPEIAPPQITVSTTYAGASAGVVADTVAIPIEDELNGVDDLLYFSSTCDNLGWFMRFYDDHKNILEAISTLYLKRNVIFDKWY